MSRKIKVMVFDGSAQAVQLTLKELFRDRWLSTSVLSMAKYDEARYDRPRDFGKSRIVRCELADGKRVVVILHTPTSDGKRDAKEKGEKIPEWLCHGAVIEDSVSKGKSFRLVPRAYGMGPGTQWCNPDGGSVGSMLLELFSRNPERDIKFLLGLVGHRTYRKYK